MADSDQARDDASIGDVIAQLTDDAKAYAAAELAFYRELAVTKARAARTAAVLGSIAMMFGMSALISITVGAVMVLQPMVGPLWATVIVTLTALALTALFGWLAWKRVSDMLKPEL